MLGILALNAVALIVIAIVAVVYMCRKSKLRRSGAKRRSTTGLKNGLSLRSPTPYPGPMPMSPINGQMDLAEAGGPHAYAAVAGHAPGEPEDQPLTPRNHRSNRTKATPSDHSTIPSEHHRDPRSMFSMASGSSRNSLGVRSSARYRASTAGSEMTAFVPPSPEYMKDGGRPKSYA